MFKDQLVLFCFLSLLTVGLAIDPDYDQDEVDAMVNDKMVNDNLVDASSMARRFKVQDFDKLSANTKPLFEKQAAKGFQMQPSRRDAGETESDKILKNLKQQLSDLKKGQGEKSDSSLFVQAPADLVLLKKKKKTNDPPKIVIIGVIDELANAPGDKSKSQREIQDEKFAKFDVDRDYP